jgi:hypothetical protein
VHHRTPAARWLGRAILLGAASDLCLGLPTALYGNAMLARLELPQLLAQPHLPRLGAALWLLLSLLTLPAAIAPDGARSAGRLAAVLRWALFGLFVAIEPRGECALTLLELVLAGVLTVSLFVLRSSLVRALHAAARARESHVEITA